MTFEEMKKRYKKVVPDEPDKGTVQATCSSGPYITVYVKDPIDPTGWKVITKRAPDYCASKRAVMGPDARLGAVEHDFPMMID